jgi:hypothetical protein
MAKKRRCGVNFKYLFKHGVEIECDDLLSFIHTMDSGLKGELKNFESFMDRLTKGMDENRKSETYEQYADDAFGLMDRYPIILWQSVFISLYAFFEQEMNDICRRVRRIANTKHIAKTRVRISMDVALPGHKCLAEFRVRLAAKSPEWKKFEGYVGVRNLIVHNRGHLRANDAESERVKTFARYNKHISIDHHKRIILERQFCVAMVEIMRVLLHKTIAAIPKKIFDS